MRCLIVPFVLAALTVTSVFAAPAADISQAPAEKIVIHEAWARASAGAANTGAVYLTLTGSIQPDRLVGVSTPVAPMAGVHESMAEGGVMRMRAIAALPILPGKTVTLAPGGYHIMLMDLSHPLTAGQTFPLTLKFEHAAPITVDVRVLPIGAGVSGGQNHMQMK